MMQNNLLIVIIIAFLIPDNCMGQKRTKEKIEQINIDVFINDVSAPELIVKRSFLQNIDSLYVDEQGIELRGFRIADMSAGADWEVEAKTNKLPQEVKDSFNDNPHIRCVKFYDFKIYNKLGTSFPASSKEIILRIFD